MKLRTLCTTALVGLIVGGGVAFAAEKGDPMDTTGTVKVIEGTIPKDDTDVTDPEKPETIIPEIPGVKPNPNENRGALEITHAPVLSFGEISTGTKAINKAAKGNEFEVDGTTERRGQILQFGDVRIGDKDGYKVFAQLTEQFVHTNGTDKLNGSTILFTNPYSATAAGSTGIAPTFNKTFEIGEGAASAEGFGGQQEVASADKATKQGKGLWVVEYGSSELVVAEDTTDESVFLNVPTNTAASMPGGDYEATIQWSITATP